MCFKGFFIDNPYLLERFEKWAPKQAISFHLTNLLFISHLVSKRGEAMNFSLFRFSQSKYTVQLLMCEGLKNCCFFIIFFNYFFKYASMDNFFFFFFFKCFYGYMAFIVSYVLKILIFINHSDVDKEE